MSVTISDGCDGILYSGIVSEIIVAIDATVHRPERIDGLI